MTVSSRSSRSFSSKIVSSVGLPAGTITQTVRGGASRLARSFTLGTSLIFGSRS
jgi:hypothetical protein